MKFDPMTGEPIQETVQEETPETQNLLQKVMSKPAYLAIAGIVAIAAIVLIAVFSGVFMSDRDRVATAIVNTLNDQGEAGDAFISLGKIYTENKEHTTSLMVEYSGVEVRGEYRHTKENKQVWATVDGAGLDNFEGTITLSKSQVLGYTPLLEDVLFVYNYTEKNDGYITEQVPESTIEAVNQLLELASGSEEEFEIDEEYIQDLKEWYKEIEVQKVDDKEEFEIDGKDKNCTGYEVEVTEDMLCDLLDIMSDIAEDANSTDEDLGYYFDELKDELDGMPDFDMIFYLDSNKLAAIVIDVDGNEAELLFKGGEYRMQNMEFEIEGTTVFEIEGETDGKVETVTLEVGGQEFLEYEYDAKSGDFEVSVRDYYGEKVLSVEANLVAKSGNVSLTEGNMNVEGTSVDFELIVEKGANIEKLSGEEFDLGDASYSEIYDILEELYDELY